MTQTDQTIQDQREELVEVIRSAETFREKLDAQMELARTYWPDAKKMLRYERDGWLLTEDQNRRIGRLSAHLSTALVQGYEVIQVDGGIPLYCDCKTCGKRYRFNSRSWMRKHAESHGIKV